MNKEYLYPEIPQLNPFSFFGATSLVNSDPILKNGYSFCCFVDNLDNPSPFFAAAISSSSNSTYFYKFTVSGKIPNFSEFGMLETPTNEGILIHLHLETYLRKFGPKIYYFIGDGKWGSHFLRYQTIAAYYHIDIIPNVSNRYFSEDFALDSFKNHVQELYQSDSLSKVTLPYLFRELVSIMCFFGYLDKKEIPDQDYFCFGLLNEPFNKFNNDSFNPVLTGERPITPSSVKQIRSLFKFVKLSLTKFGYEILSNEDVFISTLAAVNKLQNDNGIPEGPCNNRTVQLILNSLLRKKVDPFTDFKLYGIDLKSPNIDSHPKYGAIEGSKLDETSKRFATGVSRAIAQLPSPISNISSIRKQILELTNTGANCIGTISKNVNLINQDLKKTKSIANDLKQEVSKSLDQYSNTDQLLKGLITMNDNLDQKMDSIKLSMRKEIRKSNWLLVILIVLVYLSVKNWLLPKLRQ